MPLPKISGNESEQDYVSRCIEAQSGEDKPEDQKAAICYSIYREAKKADGFRDDVEKAAIDAGVKPDLAKSIAYDSLHKHLELQKLKKVYHLAYLVRSLAIGMSSSVRKGGKPIGTVSQRKDGKWKKIGDGEWEPIGTSHGPKDSETKVDSNKIEYDPDEEDPSRIEALHEVRDKGKVKDLAESMEKHGWVGRPILGYDTGESINALTGTHRIAAAKLAGIDVPVEKITEDEINEAAENEDMDPQDVYSEIFDARDDEDRYESLKRFGMDKAAQLLHDEIEANRIEGTRNKNR